MDCVGQTIAKGMPDLGIQILQRLHKVIDWTASQTHRIARSILKALNLETLSAANKILMLALL